MVDPIVIVWLTVMVLLLLLHFISRVLADD